MDFKDAHEKLKDDPELAKKLEEAVGRNADAKELSGILVAAGFDAELAESLVAEYQRKFGEVIALDEVDEDTLRQVAGGGSGIDCSQADDCDHHFKEEWLWDRDRCSYSSTCDEMFCQPV